MSHEGLLKDKVILVSGASRGIGHGIALALGREEGIIIGTATTPEGAERITKSLEEENIRGAGMVLNVTSQASIEEIIPLIKQQYGPITVLINNAAITHDNLFLRMKEEEWFQVIETNLNSIYRLSKACITRYAKSALGKDY